MIERGRFGGTCVNTGCMPTKTLVVSAYAARLAARAAEFGVVIDGRIAIDVGRVKARKDAVSNPYLTNDARTRRRASWVGLAGAAAED